LELRRQQEGEETEDMELRRQQEEILAQVMRRNRQRRDMEARDRDAVQCCACAVCFRSWVLSE
jgi:hypothetical protein